MLTPASSQISLENRLIQIIESCNWYETLFTIRQENLADCWVAGGAIRNTVWKHLYPHCSLTIKDIDVVFFDRSSARERELAAKASLQEKHKDLPFDVKNQDSFGNWRDWHFKFSSSADGIAHFQHTATAIGITLDHNDNLEIVAPYGLEDLFDGVIKLTPFRHEEEPAIARQKDFLQKCKMLKVQSRGCE